MIVQTARRVWIGPERVTAERVAPCVCPGTARSRVASVKSAQVVEPLSNRITRLGAVPPRVPQRPWPDPVRAHCPC